MQSIKAGSPKTFLEFPTTPSGAPAVPTKPVAVTVYDGKNQKVHEGEAFRGKAEGSFEFIWTPPGRTPSNPYRVIWQVTTAAEGFLTHRTDFEIQVEEEADFSFSTFLAEGFSRLPFQATELGQVALIIYDSRQNSILEEWVKVTQLGPQSLQLNPQTPIPAGDYTYIATFASTGTQQVGNITCPPLRFWHLLPRLRTYIDRAKAPFEQIKAYQNEHAYTWFVEALSFINSMAPVTSYSFASFPHTPHDFGMEGFLIKAAALHAIRSQLLLENELAFDYSGPNVNVTYDHTQGLEAELGRLDELREQIKETKKEMWRMGPVGSLAHRALGSRSYGKQTRMWS